MTFIRISLFILVGLAASPGLVAAQDSDDELDALFGDSDTSTATSENPAPSSPPIENSAASSETVAIKTIVLEERTPQAAPPAAPRGRVIDEIIVTAQKKAQSLQDVPVSVASFDRSFMEDAGIVDIGELVQFTPNVKFNDALGYAPVMTIRGFGTPPLGRGLEPSVGLAIDDVFYGRSTYINDTNFDIERVEVLRGPQGTLFGKNTIAGLVNFTTRDPDFEGSGYLSLATATFNEKRLEAGKSFSLIDDVLAARIAVRYRGRDNALYNTARDEQNNTDDIAGRIKLKWFINDSSDLLLNYWKSSQRALGLPLQLKKASEKSLSVFADHDPDVEALEFNGTTSMDHHTFSDRDTQSVNFKYSLDLQNRGIVSNLGMALIAGWSEVFSPYALDGDFSPIDSIRFGTDAPDFYNQTALELRFNGDLPTPFKLGDSLDFIFGIFAARSNHGVSVRQVSGADVYEYARAGGYFDPGGPAIPVSIVFPLDEGDVGETIFNSTRASTNSIAYFTQFDWQLTPTISSVIGMRYSEDSRKGTVMAGRTDTTVIAPVVAGQENFEEHLTGSDYDFTPKLSVSWQPTDVLTLYGTATEGFKSGGFAAAVFNNDNLTFEPETAKTIEFGFKSRWLDGALMVNGAAFHSRYKDLQVRNFDGRTLYVENASDAKTTGVEFDFFWLPPIDNLSIGGSAGLVEAKYIDYLCAPVHAGSAAGSGDESCFDDDNVGLPPAFQDLSGESLAFAPNVSGSLYTNYSIPVFDNIKLILGFDVMHQGEHFIDTDNDPNAKQEPTTKLNARFGLKSMNDTWSAIINVKNLTSVEESALVLDQPSIAGNYVSAALPSEPIWNVDLRYNF